MSVQQKLNEALYILIQEKEKKEKDHFKASHLLSPSLPPPPISTGCGRTDTGVHALQFFAHFDTADTITDQKDFIYKLNGILPLDITIHNLFSVKDNAHARYDATARTYHYYLHRGKNSFLKELAAPVFQPLDLNLLNSLAKLITKHDDFSSFCKSRTQSKTTICKIITAHWTETKGIYKFEITANRFLRGMVRAITGTMLNVAQEKLSKTDFVQIIEGKKRSAAGASSPACGLYLVKIVYPYLEVEAEHSLPFLS
jgi:tRNA pseudouridine38-40 synthase